MDRASLLLPIYIYSTRGSKVTLRYIVVFIFPNLKTDTIYKYKCVAEYKALMTSRTLLFTDHRKSNSFNKF